MKHLTTVELAKRWRLKEGTLRNWRSQGKGPEYIKLGGSIAYPISSIEDFENRNRVKVK